MITVVNKKTHIPTLNDYYCGRGSPLGNVYDFQGSEHPQVKFRVNTRDEAIIGFEDHLIAAKLSGDPEICHAINELIIRNFLGKDINLVCYCAPDDCHGDIIKSHVEQAKYCCNWFSNMRRMDDPICYEGNNYWTVENYYQAMKIRDEDFKMRPIIATMNPFQAKTFLRKQNIIPDWDRIKLRIMEYALRHKFQPHTSWGKKLIAFEKPIIEHNNWSDVYWGVNIFTGEGENHLGKLLEKIRDDIRD